MALYEDIAAQNSAIAQKAGFTEFSPAMAVSPTAIAASYAASGDAISQLDAQVATNKAQATADSLATRAATVSANGVAAISQVALQNQSARAAQQARVVQQAQVAGAKAGLAAYQSAAAARRAATLGSGATARGNVVGGQVSGAGARQLAIAQNNGYQFGAQNYDTSYQNNKNLDDQRNQVLATAKSYLGTGYVLGGTSYKGIDCSGLVMKVYNQLGFNITEHHATWQRDNIPGTRVAWGSSKLQPGDLVAWKDGSHIAIYAGGGQIIEAANTKVGTVQRNLWADPNAVVGIHLNI